MCYTNTDASKVTALFGERYTLHALPLDLRTPESYEQTVDSIVTMAKPINSTLLNNMVNDLPVTFPYQNYGFGRTPNSGLTKQAGLYIIINKEAKKIYLGGSTNLAQRKGEYKLSFTNPNRLHKVSPNMREDLALHGPGSFFLFLLSIFLLNL
uniref:Putative GIY YIG homing endonuclease n=1 Tax=Stephanosphaera pluvialis TaxID=51712 RepID=A0A0S2IE63_9CHLO|nr:putative GIY YIG homing endonuclease [Stephanosphaera pluvialis]